MIITKTAKVQQPSQIWSNYEKNGWLNKNQSSSSNSGSKRH